LSFKSYIDKYIFLDLIYIKQNIRHLRKSRGLSQKDFAADINVSRSVVASYESGEVIPPLIKIMLICETYELDLATFLLTDMSAGETVTTVASKTKDIQSEPTHSQKVLIDQIEFLQKDISRLEKIIREHLPKLWEGYVKR